MEQRIILASQSPRRISLLRQIGIEAEVIPSSITEDLQTADPTALVQKLSYQKADDVAKRLLSAAEGTGRADGSRRVTVIGADTVVSLGGRIMGKPASHEEAFAMIRLLQGRVHQVHTGVSLISWETALPRLPDAQEAPAEAAGRDAQGMRKLGFVEKTDVEFYPMTEEEIHSYTSTEEPMDKAGAYGIQGIFCKYIRRINGDYFNVVGLPVGHLYHTLLLLEKTLPC